MQPEEAKPSEKATDEKSLSTGDRLISSSTIQTAVEVSRKTVKRLAEEFGWTVVKFNPRLVRYHKSEVEKSLGIKL